MKLPANCAGSFRDVDFVSCHPFWGGSFGATATFNSLMLLKVTSAHSLAHEAGLIWGSFFGLSVPYFGWIDVSSCFQRKSHAGDMDLGITNKEIVKAKAFGSG